MDTRLYSTLPDNFKSAEIWKALDRIATALEDANMPINTPVSPASVTGLAITVTELTDLTMTPPDSIEAGNLRFVDDPVWGFGVYRFSEDATATDAPYFYRADDNSGVWEKI